MCAASRHQRMHLRKNRKSREVLVVALPSADGRFQEWAQKLKINILFSSSLSDKQNARAMGLLGHAEVGLGRAGIKTKETGSQTLDFDQIKSGKGMDKGALNVVFGTNEDFSGTGSGSGKQGGV